MNTQKATFNTVHSVIFCADISNMVYVFWGFLGGSDDTESACNAGDPGSIPGWGRSLEEGNGYQLQYSCRENPMNRGAWWATVHWVAKSWT